MNNQGDTFDCATDSELRLKVTASDGGDMIFIAANSYDSSNASINGGNYGVRYDLTIYVTNTSAQQRTVDMSVTAQYTGESYAGAGLPQGGATHGIPAIEWNTNADGTEIVLSCTIAAQSTESKTFNLFHAGGAALPVGLHLEIQ